MPGRSVAKARARHARLPSGNVRTYTPKGTADYEALVRLTAAEAMRKTGRPPLDLPIALEARILLPCPGSWSAKQKREACAGDIAATKKPDADNVLKSLKDACNGIVWRDDSQVVEITASKAYGDTPGVHVAVWQLDARRAPK